MFGNGSKTNLRCTLLRRHVTLGTFSSFGEMYEALGRSELPRIGPYRFHGRHSSVVRAPWAARHGFKIATASTDRIDSKLFKASDQVTCTDPKSLFE